MCVSVQQSLLYFYGIKYIIKAFDIKCITLTQSPFKCIMEIDLNSPVRPIYNRTCSRKLEADIANMGVRVRNFLGHQFVQLFDCGQKFCGHYFTQFFNVFAIFVIHCLILFIRKICRIQVQCKFKMSSISITKYSLFPILKRLTIQE